MSLCRQLDYYPENKHFLVSTRQPSTSTMVFQIMKSNSKIAAINTKKILIGKCVMQYVFSLLFLHWCQKHVTQVICFRPLRKLRSNYYETLTQQISPTIEVWQLVRKVSCLCHWRGDLCLTSFFTAVNDRLSFPVVVHCSWMPKCTVLVKEIFSWFSESNKLGSPLFPVTDVV